MEEAVLLDRVSNGLPGSLRPQGCAAAGWSHYVIRIRRYTVYGSPFQRIFRGYVHRLARSPISREESAEDRHGGDHRVPGIVRRSRLLKRGNKACSVSGCAVDSVEDER